MARSKWWRWSARARMLLTLELAIVLPAAALIGFSVWNLRSIQRDRAVEAAIQRDFSQVLKIAEKKINEKARRIVGAARAEFPCPDDKGAIAAKLDVMLRNHPEFAYGFLYDKKTNTFVGRIQPSRLDDPDLRAEGEKWFGMAQAWLPQDSKEMVEKQVAGAFDMISHASCLGGADLSATIKQCYSYDKATGKTSDSNFTKFKNAEFVDVLGQFSSETDAQRKLEYGNKLNAILNEEVPSTGITAGGRAYGWFRYLKGLPEIGGISDYNTYQWDFVWLDK